MEGSLLDGGERTQSLMFGIAGFTGSAAAGLNIASEAAGLTFELGAASKAPVAAEAADLEAANVRLKVLQDMCFAAGTPLLAPEGPKYIEDFRVGDLILSRDENDPESPVVVR